MRRHRRPVIGICPAIERARWGVWDDEALLLPRSYTRRVLGAGGLPVVLVPDEHLVDDPDPLLDLLDGLLLVGGVDVDPALYGAERHPETDPAATERDAFELAVLRRAMDRDVPVLAVCRGMQVLNVARGGTVRQHLPEEFGHHEHRRTLGSFDQADHDVLLEPGSLAARAAGAEHHHTKSHHHQGVGRIGEGLRVTGWAEMDELPEALEDEEGRWVLGVQWHPEADELSPVIAALVREAASRLAGAPAEPVPRP